MKKTLFIILGMLLSTQLGYSQETAKVYFMRTTGFQGSAQGFTAFIDGELTCKLNNKRYSVHEVAPGTHLFSVQFAGKKSKEKAAKEQITISVEAGKTYYIQMLFQTGILANNLYCQEVTENSANTILPNLQEDTKCL